MFATIGAVAVPETVRDEIRQKARQERRFAAASRVIDKLPVRLFEVLSDNVTPELAATIARMTGIPMLQRKKQPKDLGETMVIAHAVVAAEAGDDVTVLIDDQDGKNLAAFEAKRLLRRRQAGYPVGRLSIITTITVLKNAAGKEHIPDRIAMRNLYERLRTLDDGLMPLNDTGLMVLNCWQ